MNIVGHNKIEDCFDGSQVLQYVFNEPWTKESIHTLKSLGTLEYFGSFPRPFFRLITDKGTQLKGVEGERDCRVIFPKKHLVDQKQLLDTFFSTNEQQSNRSKTWVKN